jgi:hypothetical protein
MAISQKNNLPNISMDNFLGALSKLNYPARSCRFMVKIVPRSQNPILKYGRDLHFVCDAAEFPGRGFNVTDVRYYGPSQTLPNNSMYSPTNLSFICRTDSLERQFFDDWMDYINPTTNYNFEYAENYYCDVFIYQFAEHSTKAPPVASDNINLMPVPRPDGFAPDIIYGWTLRRAWPMLVAPQQVTWADNDILRLQVTFTYKHWDREDFKRIG